MLGADKRKVVFQVNLNDFGARTSLHRAALLRVIRKGVFTPTQSKLRLKGSRGLVAPAGLSEQTEAALCKPQDRRRSKEEETPKAAVLCYIHHLELDISLHTHTHTQRWVGG